MAEAEADIFGPFGEKEFVVGCTEAENRNGPSGLSQSTSLDQSNPERRRVIALTHLGLPSAQC